MSQRKLIFLHIPKTGGTSLVKLFNKQYRPQHIAYIHGNDQRAFDTAIADRKKFVHGHFTTKLALQAPSDFFKITLLRDPVARVISRYVHMAHTSDASLQKEFSQYASFEDYLQTPYARNFQCQMLADLLFSDASEESIYARASKNLNKMDWVAPSEKLEEAAKDLQKRLGFKPKKIGRSNTRSSNELWQKLFAEFAEQIAGLNQWDQKLYEEAAKKYEALPRVKRGLFGFWK